MCQVNKLSFHKVLKCHKGRKEETSQDKYLQNEWKDCSGKLTSP